ncbi:MAG: ABC transporter permease, partial [Smithella sp.]
MRTFRIILGLIIDLILFGLLGPWIAIRTGRIFDAAFPVLQNANHLLFNIPGIILLVLGAMWFFWAWFLLVKQGHGYMTELFGIEISPVTQSVVTAGPYSVHRHPVCAGYLLIIAGIGLLMGSPGVVVTTLLLLPVVYLYLRIFEEPALRRRLGHDYEIYSDQVPMFFPFRRKRIPVAFKNLRADRVRFLINVLGVAFSILLICFQLSVLKGTRSQITSYIDHTGAHFWVMQKGVDDLVATSVVPKESVETIEKLGGVKKATGIYAVYTLLEINQVKSRIYVIGYDTVSGNGGPWKLGETLPHIRDARSLGQDEVLLDDTLASRHNLRSGDRISLFGHSFTVAGFTQETTSIGSQYVFLPEKTVSKIMPGGHLSFTHILVWQNGTVPADKMVSHIADATGLTCVTRDILDANMREFLGMFMLPLLTAGVIMGFLVGSITICITLYAAVLERIKESGTMKALGA